MSASDLVLLGLVGNHVEQAAGGVLAVEGVVGDPVAVGLARGVRVLVTPPGSLDHAGPSWNILPLLVHQQLFVDKDRAS